MLAASSPATVAAWPRRNFASIKKQNHQQNKKQQPQQNEKAQEDNSNSKQESEREQEREQEQQGQEQEQEDPVHSRRSREARDFFASFLVTGSVLLGIHYNLASMTKVQGRSMLPTFQADDRVVFTRWPVADDQVKRGDVVVLKSPHKQNERLIKRVIALPGDLVMIGPDHMRLSPSAYGVLPEHTATTSATVEVHNAEQGSVESVKLVADNQPQEAVDEPQEEVDQSPAPRWLRIPEGHCWIEGDNGSHSLDSHMYGSVPMALLEGVVKYTVWPPKRFLASTSDRAPSSRCYVLPADTDLNSVFTAAAAVGAGEEGEQAVAVAAAQ